MTQAQQLRPDTSSSCSVHQPCHTKLWDGVPLFNEDQPQVCQCSAISHSMPDRPAELIPQVFDGIEVRAARWPFHPLNALIPQVLVDDPCSMRTSVVILEDGIRSMVLGYGANTEVPLAEGLHLCIAGPS